MAITSEEQIDEYFTKKKYAQCIERDIENLDRSMIIEPGEPDLVRPGVDFYFYSIQPYEIHDPMKMIKDMLEEKLAETQDELERIMK